MAIKVPYDLNGLAEWADELELEVEPTGKKGRFMAEDYIYKIREYFLNKKYGNNLPKKIEMALLRKSPMLAVRIDKYSEEFQDEVAVSDNYRYEEKLNGIRAFMIFDGKELSVFSRHNSREDLLPIEITNNIKQIKYFNDNKLGEKLFEKYPFTFQVDGELDMNEDSVDRMKSSGNLSETSTKLQAVTTLMNSLEKKAVAVQNDLEIELSFNLFDCVNYKNKNIDSLPLNKRLKALEIIKEHLKDFPFLNIKDVRFALTKEEKEALLNEMILTGKEGIVAKDINSPYRSDHNRDETWVKIKPSVTYRNRIIAENKGSIDTDEEDIVSDNIDLGIDTLNIGNEPKFKDTIDAFITKSVAGKGNFTGYIGAVELSTYIVKPNGERYKHIIAWISGFDMETRSRLTEIVDSEPVLNKKYLGEVWEIDGQGISPISKRLNHARLIQIREDKSPEECETPEEILNYII